MMSSVFRCVSCGGLLGCIWFLGPFSVHAVTEDSRISECAAVAALCGTQMPAGFPEMHACIATGVLCPSGDIPSAIALKIGIKPIAEMIVCLGIGIAYHGYPVQTNDLDRYKLACVRSNKSVSRNVIVGMSVGGKTSIRSSVL